MKTCRESTAVTNTTSIFPKFDYVRLKEAIGDSLYCLRLRLLKIDKKIAMHVISEIEDGSCIQLGIGGMPNALGKMIAESDLKDQCSYGNACGRFRGYGGNGKSQRHEKAA